MKLILIMAALALLLCSCMRTSTDSDTESVEIKTDQRQEYHDGSIVVLGSITETVTNANTRIQTTRQLEVPPVVKRGLLSLTGGFTGMGGIGDIISGAIAFFAGKKAVDAVKRPVPIPQPQARDSPEPTKRREDEIEKSTTQP